MVAAAIPTNRLALVGYGVADGAHVNLNACMLFVDIDPAFQTVLPNFTAILTGAFAPAEGSPTLSMGIAGGGEGSRQPQSSILRFSSHYSFPLGAEARLVCQMICRM
jgi:hypothetical protein